MQTEFVLCGCFFAGEGGNRKLVQCRGLRNMEITTIRLTWKKICKIAGLTDVRPHDLRHTFFLYPSNAANDLVGVVLGAHRTDKIKRPVV